MQSQFTGCESMRRPRAGEEVEDGLASQRRPLVTVGRFDFIDIAYIRRGLGSRCEREREADERIQDSDRACRLHTAGSSEPKGPIEDSRLCDSRPHDRGNAGEGICLE